VPRVSVIIPAFNAEKHLDETLGSVLSQTFHDLEIVVADDASHDRTVEIARAHGSAVKVVRNTETLGPAATRNAAVAASSGELLAFLDADDYWLDGYLEEQVHVYDASERASPGVGVVACDARILEGDGFLSQTYLEAIHCPDNVGLDRLLESNPIFISSVTPRTVFDEAGGFDPGLFGTEDHDLWIRTVELGYRIVISRRALAVYRLGQASVSANPGRMAANEQLVYRRALERGRLSRREEGIARRELRHREVVERISTADGISYGKAFRHLPSLTRVVLENPRSWRSLPRLLSRGREGLSTRFE
jgi:glycosyltransferase involved in cell wall biosynthesis